MRKIIILIFVLVSLFTSAHAEQMDHIDADTEEASRLMPDFDFREAAKEIEKGGRATDLKSFWNNILLFLKDEFTGNLSLIGGIIVIVVLSGILSGLEKGFGKGGVRNVSFFICYLASLGAALTAFGNAADRGLSAVRSMNVFINSVIPFVGTMLLSSGSVATAALQPGLLAATAASSALINTVGIPALYISLALTFAGNISENVPVGKLGKLIRKTALWIVCGSMTLFSAIMAISGFGAGTLDGVTVKTAKFAVSSTVPVLGSMLSEAAEAVAAGAVLIKNAAGAAGVIFIIIVMLYPVLKIVALRLGLSLAAALTEPVADKRIITVLSEIGAALGALAAMVLAAGVMSIITLGILIKASNMGVMLR